jgi:hypothetical protein
VTKHGKVENVPLIRWVALQPYWSLIVGAIIEVVTENKFRPYPASQFRPDGIVASSQYWDSYNWNPYEEKEFIFLNALKFIDLLKSKEEFITAIRSFNANTAIRSTTATGTDWLDSKNVPVLGGWVYTLFLLYIGYHFL